MTPEYLQNLIEAIKKTHGIEAKHLESVPIVETFQGKVAWAGEVEVFSVDHPEAKRCYAWGYKENGHQESVAVLGLDPVKGPRRLLKPT